MNTTNRLRAALREEVEALLNHLESGRDTIDTTHEGTVRTLALALIALDGDEQHDTIRVYKN